MAIELPQEFDKARDEASFREHRQAQLVHNSAQADGVGEFNNTGAMAGAAGAAKQVSQAQSKTEKGRKAVTEAQILLASINAAQKIADAAAARAEVHENNFRAEFGDDWLQDIALRVFDPDEFPQKQDDETFAEYEVRLEQELIEKMIDQDTGKIKDEFKNDPDRLRYAEWAQDRFIERTAKAKIEVAQDPNSTPEEVRAAVNTLDTLAKQKQALQETNDVAEPNKEKVEEMLEVKIDESVSSNLTATSDSGFSLSI